MIVATAWRAAVATALVIGSLLAVAVQPAVAATVLTSCQGQCGTWRVTDTVKHKGARCLYEDTGSFENPQWIDEITIRPPTMYSRTTNPSTVGWRFKIQQYKDAKQAYRTVYTSKYQTAQATFKDAASAGNGFTRRAFTGPFKHDGSAFRVVIEMQWWKEGTVAGYVKVRYERYRAQRSGQHFYIAGRCFSNFQEY